MTTTNTTTTTTTTIKMSSAVERIRNSRIPEIEDEQEDALRRADRYDPPENDRQAALFEEARDRWQELEARKVTMRGRANAIEEYAYIWSDSYDYSGGEDEERPDAPVPDVAFVAAELTAGQTRKVRDELRRRSDGSVPEGTREIRMIQESLASWPAGAPTTTEQNAQGNPVEVPDPAEYPDRVFDWVSETVNSINTVGGETLGNSSFREAMEDHRS